MNTVHTFWCNLFGVFTFWLWGASGIADLKQEANKKCDGEIMFKRLSQIPADMAFYVQTRGDGKSCVETCFENLYFCRSVVYVPEHKTCYFSYWSGDECNADSTSTDFRALVNDVVQVFACVSCYRPLSFIQYNPNDPPPQAPRAAADFAVSRQTDNRRNSLGFLGSDHNLRYILKKADPAGETEADEESGELGRFRAPFYKKPRIRDPTSEETLIQNPAYKYLMPECEKPIRYSTYAILNTEAFSAYVSRPAESHRDCASLCWRQHFCVSALYSNKTCMMSHKRGICTNTKLPLYYNGPVLISCVRCGRKLL